MKAIIVCCLAVAVSCFAAYPDGGGSVVDVSELEEICSPGGMENSKKCITYCKALLEKEPDSFEALWKASRACNRYGKAAKEKKVDGWEDICRRYGEKGMAFAQQAIDLKPDRPEGYFFYGINIGIYADGVSWFTAMRRGLKDKTQKTFEKVYEIDKMFYQGEAIVALGRFWSVLPWPYRDRERALRYFREYQETPYFKDDYAARLYLAELLLQIGGKENVREAALLLQEVTRQGSQKQREKALELMENV